MVIAPIKVIITGPSGKPRRNDFPLFTTVINHEVFIKAWVNTLMSWPNIVSAVVGGLVGGLAGYIISIASKPGFRYIGITGNTLGASLPFSSISTQTLQCGARFEVAYHWRLGERFVARNSRGWLAIYDNSGNRVHNSPGIWGWNYVVGMDIVGEESLILFHVYPVIGNPSDPALIVVPIPVAQFGAWSPYISYQCLDYNNYLARNPQYQRQFSQVCRIRANQDFMLEIRVASENAHGAKVRMGLGDVLGKCLESLSSGGRPVK